MSEKFMIDEVKKLEAEIVALKRKLAVAERTLEILYMNNNTNVFIDDINDAKQQVEKEIPE